MAAVARASYNCYVSWLAYNLGLFTIGTSTLSGTDVFGTSPLDSTFNGTYDNVSTRLADATVSRGRDNNLDVLLAGNANIDLRDPTGIYNPENTAGPLYGQLEDRLHPVKLTATYAGTTYGLFYGWVRKFHWQPQGRRGITQLECVDLFYWLDRARPVIASTGATTTGAAIGKILDAVGATDPGMRNLSVGDNIPDFSADGSKSGLELIRALLDAERGLFYIDGSGVATYVSRIARITAASLATIADKMSDLQPGVDTDQAYTRITVVRTQSGYKAIAYDSVGVSKWGYNDLPEIDTAYLLSDAQTDQLSIWVLNQNLSARPPVRDFQLDNREAALLTQLLARKLVDRVTVTDSRGGNNGDFYIDRADHSINGRSGRHACRWLLSKRSGPAPFVIGTSTLSGGDVLVYGSV